ncbi:MAG: PKD domain-containing protein [Anaerolineae bacterium]|nr:PKD domain-containing protein [Anaerolineae bacterium]
MLQYQLEYGPDPNPGNLWYPATGIVQSPVLNGLLGIWNTTAIQDSVYQLRLRVILRDGTSLATVVNNIRVRNQSPTPIPSATPSTPRPIAAFTLDRSSGQTPLVVRFTNQSSGSITTYNWSFGDGGGSTEASPVYTFRTTGIYNVTLTVSGPGGSSNVSRQINVLGASAPVAAFTQDLTNGPSPLNVRFTNQSTGQITAYSWTFGDGQTSTEQNPTHQFTAVGTYNVILSVTGPGGTSFVTRKITVQDPVIPAPDAVFSADKTSGNTPLTIQFTNQSTGQITSYNWDFGDGQTSVDTSPSHIYTVAGTYRVLLTVIGPGGQDIAEISIAANAPPNAPAAAFNATPISGDAPLNVSFTNQSTGNITGYSWDFGDGQTSTEQSPSHSYTTPGTYTVKLIVTGPGGSNEAQTTITATQPIAAPVASFTVVPTSGTAPLNVQFTNQSTGESLSYVWNFGDSTPNSTEINPLHSFVTPGSYTVTLTVSNSAGSTNASTVITVNAAPVAPVAAFTANPTTGDAPLSVVFDSSTSTGSIDSYAWDFGDGGTSAESNPTYSFVTPGNYTVMLTVSNSAGSTNASTVITVNAVTPPPPPINNPILFVSNRDGNNELYILGTDETLTNLTNNAANDFSPTWSPDGSQIVFVSDRDGNNELYIMNDDGGDVRRLTDNPADDLSPMWSLTGNQIAFVTNRDGNNEIYAMDTEGNNLINITNNPASDTNPAPAPNGNLLAFVSDRDGNAEIYIQAADGTVTNITNTPDNDFSPVWSPDSNQIAFVTNRDGNNELYIMNADGNNPARITNDPGDDRSPAWSSDNSQLAFTTNRDGNDEIYVIEINGANPANVTNNGANDISAIWRP